MDVGAFTSAARAFRGLAWELSDLAGACQGTIEVIV